MDFSEPWNDSCSHVGQAARFGDLKNMKLFIESKMPVDVADNRGWRPLHEAAAISPNLDCLEELLKHEKTNVNWTTHEGETALLLACKRRHDCSADRAVQLLLQYGADANIVDNEEESPLLAATRNGNIDVIQRFIESESVDVNSADCSGWHPLHECARHGNTEMLQFLLNAGARLNVRDECGMTPIFTAAQHGNDESLQALLNCATERDQIAVVNVGAEDWATPLMIAAQQDFVNCVKILLDYGADPDLRTCDNAMAIHMAVQGDYSNCLDLLLKKTNLEPLQKKFHPSTNQLCSFDVICPLHLAVEWKSHTCLEKLLAAGFSPDSLYNCISAPIWEGTPCDLPKFETALSYAVHHKNKDAISILLKAGASCNPPSKLAFHPLMRALYSSSMEVLNILIENGGDVNYQMLDLPTNELLLLSFSTNISVVKNLLSYGCDPSLCFQEGNPLSLNLFLRCVIAYAHNNCETLKDLLMLILNFVIISKPVQVAFRTLCTRAKGCPSNARESLWEDILHIINQPSSLRQICFVSIRQHLYSIHGVNVVKVVKSLNLPPSLEDYIACHHLRSS